MGAPIRPDLLAFGATVRRLRRSRGWNTGELARRAGCKHGSSVTYWEAGRNEPTDTVLVGLARALGVPVKELAGLLPRYQMDGSTIGQRMVLARWDLGLTVDELAERTGVKAAHLRHYELDQSIPVHHAGALEGALGPLAIERVVETRPKTLRYMGKKTTGSLLPLIPVTDTYVEPYGGSASVLFAREPVEREVYNDLNDDLVNLFRALRTPRRAQLLHERASLTLYSRAEYIEAIRVLEESKDGDERAWALFVLLNQSWNGVERWTAGNWSNGASVRKAWWSRVAWAGGWHERLAAVIVEHGDALDVIRRYDSPTTTFYLDPPYVRSARRAKQHLYRKESTNVHHIELVKLILTVQGAVVLSGYAHPLYEPLEAAGWERTDIVMRGRTESVWRNPHCVQLTERKELAS